MPSISVYISSELHDHAEYADIFKAYKIFYNFPKKILLLKATSIGKWLNWLLM